MKYKDLILGFSVGLLIGLLLTLFNELSWQDKTRYLRSDVKTFKAAWLDAERRDILHDIEIIEK